MNAAFHVRRRRLNAGFSLIELMISMVIGLVVIGAMFAAYVGSGMSGRNSRALAQITEDASIALNVLRSAVGMVGYGTPYAVTPAGQFNVPYAGVTLFGCNNTNTFTATNVDIGALTCPAGAGATDTIAVAYEADLRNSVLNSAGNAPVDCLGGSIAQVAAAPPIPAYWLAYNRYYVSNGSLFCVGPSAAAGQALVDNVIDLQIKYGVANVGPNITHQVARYEDANGMNAADFANTLSVRICIVVASADNVMDTMTQYRDCSGQLVDPPGGDSDRRMFHAFTSTIVLQNRLEGAR